MNRFITATLLLMMVLLSPVQAATADSHPSYNPNEYAVVFFFRSDCNYCHLFAPTLKQFEQQTGLYTYAFSFDGQGMKGFEVPIPVTKDTAEEFFDNPRSATLPATFLINVNSRKFARMTQGNVSLQGLHETYTQIRRDPAVIEALRP
ncbi:type-F conjugative transfer system pilin assembly thiol-disulfide isomerase TrbB [Photobacterium frigidiphilum]|uniref:Type-F conjugative transfer system pilin assembly thiol-disulfide isomerase TrbB n=1 Tax=Photobacterium frigidiphilum TaxID=264736 RepID=A0A2T3J5Q4_9GAMM|nr:type-F conjugative transfer system pilin assembly thiol-disulfide isomerase TrbB [Photobacterium frigidiphilum]PSU41458.1 type-F conjugative transfer system pilin assembly thiol-disulfide isomerase TrbB [Photobacterium frigidiphilum]